MKTTIKILQLELEEKNKIIKDYETVLVIQQKKLDEIEMKYNVYKYSDINKYKIFY